MLDEVENLGQNQVEAEVDPADEVWGDESSTGLPKKPERIIFTGESHAPDPEIRRKEERKSDNLRAGV